MPGSVQIGAPPPPTIEEPERGGGERGWVVLCTTGDRYEAEMIRGVLETNELGPVVIERIAMMTSWLFPSGDDHAPHRVMVRRIVVDACRLSLLEIGVEVEPEMPSDPPSDRKLHARRWLRAAVLLAVLATVIGYLVRLMGGDARIPS